MVNLISNTQWLDSASTYLQISALEVVCQLQNANAGLSGKLKQ